MLEFDTIKLNGHEIQSGSTRVDWAEGLILQLPEDHDGRNSWLLNYGISEVANEIRNNDTVKRHEEGCSPRVLEWEHKIFPKAIELFVDNRLRVDRRIVRIDGEVKL